MAHLLIFRVCSSFSYNNNTVYGPHEKLEREIDKRKYKIKRDEFNQEGYTTPFASRWMMLDYRIKEDIVAEFLTDLNAFNLNPVDNNIKLKDILFPKYNHKTATVGRLLLVVQWLFKWLNKKPLLSMMLSLVYVFSVVFGLQLISLFTTVLLICLINLNPVKPVGKANRAPNKFITEWHYNFCFGKLTDMKMVHGINNDKVHYDAL